MVDSSTLSAVNAYKNQLKLIQGNAVAPMEDSVAGPSFMNMLKDAASDAIATQHRSEALQLESLTGGNVDLTDLVTAVSEAELTVSTVVAIRDRVINAYQEIIRMPL
ncbi:MAG: flagellar hook-basal body complex protein FliE [Alphaproteobacteria bacterium]